MIDFTRAELIDFTAHYVGNKGLGEELAINDKQVKVDDDFTKDTLIRYLTSPFKTDMYYQFKSKNEMNYHDVASYVSDLFKDTKTFMEYSAKLAEALYNQSMHPKIAGGVFYTCYFKDCNVDGVICDAIGIFKTEKKDTYLKVDHNFHVECDNGINVNKLDKGCLIFNTEQENGYKISVIDNNNKIADCAFYWVEDFLNVKIKENAYFHTSNFIDTCVGFCEEILTESNNVTKDDQAMMLNKSVNFFKEKDKFVLADFKNEVLAQDEIKESFDEYRSNYNDKMDLKDVKEFDISATAVKKNQKYCKSLIKLDKNFHVYIHARHENMERGYDEEKGLKFIKLYYTNETD